MQLRVHVMTLLILGAASFSAAQAIWIDCGGPGFEAPPLVFQGDRPYQPGGFGFVGGHQGRGIGVNRVDGSSLVPLYRNQRLAMQAYRFDLPAGTYALELFFAETQLHGPGLRVFDVAAEGQLLLDDFDIFAFADKDYAVVYRFPVTVLDGVLDVEFLPESGVPALAGIGVVGLVVDAIAPPRPQNVEVRGGYHRAILVWNPVYQPDLAGYLIERSPEAGGPFEMLTTDPHPLTRYFDDAVVDGETWHYRLRAVDLWGNQSPPSPVLTATILGSKASALPVYEISLDEADLSILQADPFVDDYVPAAFEHLAVEHPDVGLRFRGNVTRNQRKKSWKVNFPGSEPFIGRDKLNLNAEANDPTMLKEKLSYGLLAGLNVHAPSAEFAHVEVNGLYKGVFSQVENVDLDFLERRGIDTGGALYKADSFQCNFELLPSEDDYRRAWEKKSNEDEGYNDLISMIEAVNTTPDDDFLTMITGLFDVDALLDYYAAVVLTSNFDHVFHNYYVYFDPEREIWELLPKDWNGTFEQIEFAVDYGTENSPGGPGGGQASNVLMTRILDVPELRLRFAGKLLELLDDDFSAGVQWSRIDAFFSAIEHDAQLDVDKAGAERNEVFLNGPEQLRRFLQARSAWLRPETEQYRPDFELPILINELSAIDDWIELYNASDAAIDLADWSLSDKIEDPQRWVFPEGSVIAPGERLLIDNAIGLSRDGESLYLFGPSSEDSPLVDFITFDALEVRTSFGRRHDGSFLWAEQAEATPGAANTGPGAQAPVIWGLETSTASSNQEIHLTAIVESETEILEATLQLDTDEGWTTVPMFDDGLHGDEAAKDGLYAATIGPFQPGAIVHMVIEASDANGLQGAFPLRRTEDPATLTIPASAGDLILNELQADNETTLADESGEYDDWIEIHNRGNEPIDLTGLTLSDDPDQPDKWPFPAGATIAPGEYLIIWADDQPEQGPNHATFKLSKSGEDLVLFDTTTNTILDHTDFPAQSPDESWSRLSNDEWALTTTPTPGAANAVSPRRPSGRVGG